MTDIRANIAGAAAVFTLLFVVFTAVSVSTELPVSRPAELRSAPEPSAEPSASPAPELQTAAEAAPARRFTLREYGGAIAVFEYGASEPFMTLDVPVAALRPVDAEALARGITVTGEVELARLVEDFDG